MSKEELMLKCKEKGIKGYSRMNKEQLISLLDASDKKNMGQFYTTNSSYILEGLPSSPDDVKLIIEPFAGKGDLIEWLKRDTTSLSKIPIQAYDIDPKNKDIQKRDTLTNPPDYNGAWIITNPPYLARNKSEKKDIYDLYDTNDLYKCFLLSLSKQNNCKGGIVIIPAGFFFSARDIDVRCRNEFMTKFRITKVKYFEETVFDDTSTTIVAFSFEKSDTILSEQNVEWVMMPSKTTRTFNMSSNNDWIVGGDIYSIAIPSNISVRRYVEGQILRENEEQTFMTLNALDSGTKEGRICLTYKKDYLYPAKESSRTFATLRITGRALNENEQVKLCEDFNKFIERKREETWSLFLPQFRESKEYARKRIPFELAYRIVLHLVSKI
jgi:hypothetical protein